MGIGQPGMKWNDCSFKTKTAKQKDLYQQIVGSLGTVANGSFNIGDIKGFCFPVDESNS